MGPIVLRVRPGVRAKDPPGTPNQAPVEPTQIMLPTTITLAQTLPEGGMVSLVIGLVAGLALWLAGVKIVRGVFLALGAAVGSFAGAVIMPLLGMPAFDLGSVTLTPGFTGLIVGGIIGALVAMAMLRVVVIITAAGAMAVVGAMAALVFVHVSPAEPADAAGSDAAMAERAPDLGALTEQFAERAREQTDQALDLLNRSAPDGSTGSGFLDDLNTEENRERLRDAAERSKAFMKAVGERLRTDYEARPDRDKLVILSGTLAGLALGLLMGVAMPKRSSALVTSLAGSALWLSAGVALVKANSDPTPGFVQQPPLVWAVVWGVAAVAGMAIQFGLIKRRGEKKAEGGGES